MRIHWHLIERTIKSLEAVEQDTWQAFIRDFNLRLVRLKSIGNFIGAGRRRTGKGRCESSSTIRGSYTRSGGFQLLWQKF